MSSAPVKTRSGRPLDASKREAALDAAWTMFIDHGFDGTTMEGVATAAGVAKVTLYKHFPDKMALFEAVIRRNTEKMDLAGQTGPSRGGLRARLITFGTILMRFLFSDEIVRFDAMLRAEVHRVPGLADHFWQAGPAQGLAHMAAILEEAKAAGEISYDNVDDAVEDLAGLWMGMGDKRRALGADRSVADRRVERGVDLFLKLYEGGGGANG